MNKRISQFDIVDTLEPDDFIPIVNQQVTKKTQLSAINNIPITFAKETFLPLIGGTVTGNLQVDNDLYVKNNLYTDDTVTVVNLLSTRDHKTSKEWSSAYTAVTQSSASWGSGGTLIQSNSAKWESAYTTVNANSARWETAYTIIEQNADAWNNTLDGTGNSGYISKFLDITEIGNSGIYENIAGDVGIGISTPLNAKLTVNGKIKGLGDLEVAGYSLLSSTHVRGTLRVDGTLSALGGTVNITTVISETSSLKINNFGVGPALSVTQTGAQPVATFSDENGAILCITDGANVGIGPNACSPDPTSKLDVKGALRVDGAKIRTWYTSAELEFDTVKPGVSGPSSSEFGTIFEGIQDGHLLIGLKANDANDGFAIVSKGTTDGYNQFSKYDKNCFTVLNTGKVGIGSRKPTQELHVVGTYLQTIDSSGDYVIKVQDGTGRVNHYWNTLGGITPSFTRGGESAARWLFGGAEGQNPFEVFISQNGTTQGAGDAITWTKLFTVNRNHYVGIGVDTPSRHLHIANRTAASAEIVLEQANSLADFRKWNFVVDGGSELAGGVRSRFYIRQLNDAGNGGNIPVYIEGNGRVGIGETNPAAQLDVTGNIKMGNLLTTGKGANTLGDDVAIEHGIHRTADGEVYIDFHSTPGTDYNARIFKGSTVNGDFSLNNRGTGTFNIIQENASSINLHTSNLKRVEIDSAGNVGIGLVGAPTAKLDVNGHTKITSNAQLLTLVGTDHSYIGWFPHGSATRKGYTGYPSLGVNAFWIANEINDGTGHIVLSPGTNGLVGVHTSVPNKTLTVVGDISASNIVYDKMEGSNIVPKAGNSMIWNDKIDSDAPIDVSRVGAQTFINADIKGSFEGPQSSYYSSPYFIFERDGALVGLRGGSSDGYTEKQYFVTASNNSLTNLKNTDNEYRPPFLASTEFVSTIIDGNEHGFYCLIGNTVGAANKYYWIHTNGTLDPAFHTYDNITALAAATSINISLGSIVYCKELDWWLTVFKSTDWNRRRKELNYRFYRRSDSAQMAAYTKRVGVVGQTYLPNANPNLPDVLTTDYNVALTFTDPGFNIYGFTVNHTAQQRVNLRYDLNGNSLLISDLCSFYVDGVTWDMSCNYNSVFTYDTGANTFTEEYAFPHNFNMSDSTSWNAPFFSMYSHVPGTAGASWWAGLKFSQRKSPNNNTVISTYKEWGASVLQYGVRTDSINTGNTWADVLRRPFHSTNRPHTQINWIWSIPTDASLLGKQIINGYWVSPNKIRAQAYSKQSTEATGSYKWSISNISNINNRRGASNNNLDVPSEITQDTVITDHLRPSVSVVRSDGTMRLKRYNTSTRVYSEWNGDTMTIDTDNLATLPADWDTRLDNLLAADGDRYTTTDATRASYLYHLTGNLFLHVFTYAKTGENKTYCSLLSLNAGTGAMTWLGTKRQLETSAGPGISNSIVTDSAYQSAGMYIATDGTINVIFQLPLTQGHIHRIHAIKTNTLQTDITNWANTGIWHGWWHQVQAGVHPTFGPHVTVGHNDNYASILMSYRDRTGIVENVNTKLTTCFNEILNGRQINTAVDGQPVVLTTYYDQLIWWTITVANRNVAATASTLRILTLQSATGFVVYNSEIPVFIKGREYKIPTGSNDMNTNSLWLGSKPNNLQNRTVFVYAIVISGQAKIMFSLTKNTSTSSAVFIGVVTTNSTGIATSDLVSATTIANTIHVNGLTKDITIEGKLNTTKDISTTGKLTSEGGLTLKNSLLSEYTVPVKTVTFAAGSTDYTLASTDSGGVIVIAAASGANGIIRVPNGFPTGYSVMIVNRSTRTVSVQSATINGGTVVNVNSKISIGTQYGICNLIYIDSGTALISGDLT